MGIFTGNIVSNSISYAVETINPNSNTNRLGRLETAYNDMKKNYEITRQVDRGILENIDKLSNVVQETVKRVNEHILTFPQYTWLSSLIVNKITQSALELQRVADEAKRGRIAVQPFARLTGLVGLKDLTASNTRLLLVTKLNEWSLNFKFTVMVNSPDTKVYRVFAFDHWDNLDEVPRLMHYIGNEYLIYNETSNCIKALSGRPDDYVSDQCLELDGEDPALNQWEISASTLDIEGYSNHSQVKKTPSFNYIYCFPGSIEINRQLYKCPLDTFRLKANREFRTARQRHVPSQVSLNSTRDEYAIPSVHSGHFRDDSDVVQHLAMFEQLRHERKRIYNLTSTYDESLIIKKTSPTLWAVILIWITTVPTAIIYFIIVYWSRTHADKKLENTRVDHPTLQPFLRPSFLNASSDFIPLNQLSRAALPGYQP